MSGPEDEYQDPHGECAHEISRLTAELGGARADRDALAVEVELLKGDQIELAGAAVAYICKGRDGRKEEARLRAAVEKAHVLIEKGGK